MSAVARNLTDFNKFPGSIIEPENVYKFNMLYKLNSHGKMSHWQAVIRLVKNKKGLLSKARSQNWNLMKDSVIPMMSVYLTDADTIPEGTIAQIWIEKGIEDGKLSRFPPSYMSAKNVGKANARNALMSAMIYCHDKYIDMMAKGYNPNRTDAESGDVNMHGHFDMLYPMLAVKFKDKRDEAKFPGVGQPKIDGVHCIAYLKLPGSIRQQGDMNVVTKPSDEPDENEVSYTNVIMYSRSNKDFPGFKHIRKQLLPLLIDMYDWKNHESLYVDGELYKHGLLLQEITSIARNKSKNSKPSEYPLEFWIFDCFYPSATVTYAPDSVDPPTFLERYKVLETMFARAGKSKMKRYKFDVDTMIKSVEDIRNMVNNELEYNRRAAEADEDEIVVNYRGYEDMNEINMMIGFIHENANNGRLPLAMEAKRVDYLVLVPNTPAASFTEFEFYYQGLLSVKFEGAMWRNVDGEYITGTGSDESRRSKDLQKHKPTYTREFEVIGFTSGKGTNSGAIIWICRVSADGIKFNTVPKNSSIRERRSIYKSLIRGGDFDKKYKGRMLTIEYEDISEDGAPLRAKGIGFRDID